MRPFYFRITPDMPKPPNTSRTKRIVVRTLIALGCFLAVANIAGLFMSRNVRVEVSRIVKGAPADVFEYLVTPTLITTWIPWNQLDTAIRYEYFGPTSGVGAGFTWRGNNDVGQGSWKISHMHSVDAVQCEVTSDFGTAFMDFAVKPRGAGSEVRWTFEKDLGKVPMFRLFAPLIERYVVDDLTNGLKSMDSVLKSLPRGSIEAIDIVNLPDQHVVANRMTVSKTLQAQAMAQGFSTIIQYATNNHLVLLTDKPLMVLYHNKDDSSTQLDMECAIPTSGVLLVKPPLTSYTIPGGRFVRALYRGPYEQLGEAHRAITDYAIQHKVSLTRDATEWFVVSPVHTQDAHLWKTEVYYRIIRPNDIHS